MQIHVGETQRCKALTDSQLGSHRSNHTDTSVELPDIRTATAPMSYFCRTGTDEESVSKNKRFRATNTGEIPGPHSHWCGCKPFAPKEGMAPTWALPQHQDNNVGNSRSPRPVGSPFQTERCPRKPCSAKDRLRNWRAEKLRATRRSSERREHLGPRSDRDRTVRIDRSTLRMPRRRISVGGSADANGAHFPISTRDPRPIRNSPHPRVARPQPRGGPRGCGTSWSPQTRRARQKMSQLGDFSGR